MPIAEAKRLLVHYRQCIMQFHKQLELLKQRDPSVTINMGPEHIPDGNPETAVAVAAELNHRFDIYVRLRDETDRVEALLAQRAVEREQALLANLEAARSLAFVRQADAQLRLLTALRTKMQQAALRLDPRTDGGTRYAIEEAVTLAQEVRDQDGAELQLANLRIMVDRANAACRRTAELRKQEDAASLQRVRALAEAAVTSRAHEATHAAGILKDALQELGYEVQGDFATAFVNGESTFFQSASWGDYHCQVSNDLRRNRIHFNIVRYASEAGGGSENRLRDQEMEQTWCGKLPQLLKALEDKALSIDLDRKLEAGAVEMQVTQNERLKPAERARPERSRALRERRHE